MRALTLTQPWATLIAAGEKKIETRSWSTKYRGPLAIHAAAGMPLTARRLCAVEPFASALRRAGYGGLALLAPHALPRGAIVAVCNLEDVIRTGEAWSIEVDEREAAFGDYSPGRYAWLIGPIIALPAPMLATGALGLWAPQPHVAAYCQGILDSAA